MAETYINHHIHGKEDCNITLNELKESGTYSLWVGSYHLVFIGELEDLNDIGFEIFTLTNQERERKRANLIKTESKRMGGINP